MQPASRFAPGGAISTSMRYSYLTYRPAISTTFQISALCRQKTNHEASRLSWNHDQRRFRSGGQSSMFKASMAKAMKRVSKAKNPAPPQDMQAKMLAEMLLPGVFVPLKAAEMPQEWKPWFEYRWTMLFRRGVSALSRASFWAKGVEKLTDWLYLRSRVNLETFKLASVGRDLHKRLGQAVATGDTAVLQSLCTNNLYQNLKMTKLANRTSSESIKWELVGDSRARVVAHDVSPLLKRVVQQVIVAIDSTQRLTKLRAKDGKPIPDGITERQMHENLVLLREIDPDTFDKTPWKIWGTVPGTVLDEYKATMKALEEGNRAQIKQKYPDLFKRPEGKS